MIDKIYFGGTAVKIDLLHNKIVADNITPAFDRSFREELLPLLEEAYGDTLEAVQMYEDYLADGFSADGCFYYPLSVVVSGEAMRVWVKWNISKKADFEGGVPYAYVGEKPLLFEICDEVPAGFEEKLMGRGIYFEGGCASFRIESASTDKTFLVGKYSQTFVDELTRQISAEITSAFALEGLEGSSVEIMLVFAPATYMEHIFSGVTYRRLLIGARGCNARDLWIKWSGTKTLEPLTVSDNVSSEEITFELGEDVPQKIREKEYRFLVHTSADKYQAAMGRKNITEWRDLIKRALKRGELVKAEIVQLNPEKDSEIAAKLQDLLYANASAPAAEPVAELADENVNSDLAALLKGVLGADAEEPVLEEADEEIAEEVAEEITEEPVAEEAVEEPAAEAEAPTEAPAPTTDELRRQIEAEIRHEYEREARLKAEAEAEELRRKHDELKAENERLIEAARKAEEERIQRESERAAEAERIKAEIMAREEAEARERERMAEAARIALIEQQKIAEQRAEEERLRKIEEEKRLREEAEREAARLAEEKRLAEERARAEEAARAEEERRRAIEAAEAEARAREEARRAAAAAEAKEAVDKMLAPDYTYVSKTVRLLFRHQIDPNITKRIHEIILSTIKYFHKENVYIKIRATVPDSTTVNLFFEKIPEEENELLIDIIKVLGKSELGITKVYLE